MYADQRVLGVEVQREDLLHRGVGQDGRREPGRLPWPRRGPGDGQGHPQRLVRDHQLPHATDGGGHHGCTPLGRVGDDQDIQRGDAQQLTALACGSLRSYRTFSTYPLVRYL